MSGGSPRRASVHSFVLVLSYSLGVHAQTAPSSPPLPTEWIYSIRPGDTLWALGRELLARPHEWPRVQQLNRLRDADRLVPGMRLRIPFELMKIRPVPARAIEVSGTTAVIRVDGSRVALATDMPLYSGDAVETGANGSASIGFADGSTVLLGANARMVFDRLASFGTTGMVDTRLRLDRGRARPNVMPRRGRFELWSPALQVTTRGTEFRVESADSGNTGRVEVTESEVDATAGATVRVPEGSGTVARGGGPPEAPTPLLPAPVVISPAAAVRRLPARVSAQPVAGASGYHWEVGPDVGFRRLLAESTTMPAPVVDLTDLPDGTYAIRVRAMDGSGFEGYDGVGQLEIDARPEAPFLMAPTPAAVLRLERPSFAWAQPVDAAAFHLQVSTSPAFEAVLVDVVAPVGRPFESAVALPPGSYSWRVATRLADGEEGPFSDPQRFVLRQPPPRLTPERPDLTSPTTVLRWPAAAEPNVRYHAQLAGSPGFDTLISEHTLDQPELSIPKPGPGSYWVRVRVLEADGFEGVFGEPQSFDVTAPAPVEPARPSRTRRWLWLLPAAVIVAGVAIFL
jgi:hypothetical protein